MTSPSPMRLRLSQKPRPSGSRNETWPSVMSPCPSSSRMRQARASSSRDWRRSVASAVIAHPHLVRWLPTVGVAARYRFGSTPRSGQGSRRFKSCHSDRHLPQNQKTLARSDRDRARGERATELSEQSYDLEASREDCWRRTVTRGALSLRLAQKRHAPPSNVVAGGSPTANRKDVR